MGYFSFLENLAIGVKFTIDEDFSYYFFNRANSEVFKEILFHETLKTTIKTKRFINANFDTFNSFSCLNSAFFRDIEKRHASWYEL